MEKRRNWDIQYILPKQSKSKNNFGCFSYFRYKKLEVSKFHKQNIILSRLNFTNQNFNQ